MTSLKIPYGQRELEVNFPSDHKVDWIAPPVAAPLSDPLAAVRMALRNPIGERRVDFRSSSSVAIAINDKTRPVPHHLLLPPLLDHLEELGVATSKMTLFFATGTHLPMKADEMMRLLPQGVLERVRVISHDVDEGDNFLHLGYTSRGTPITINRRYFEADFRLVVGDIELHHFAGFSGGVKSAVIGLGSRESIQHNHRMLIDEKAAMGIYEDNPLRQDIEESGDRIGIHFALNAVLNEDKKIVAVFYGNPRDVMQAGIPVARRLSSVSIDGYYDGVIASAGGYPKDINFYQAQKAITHASLFVKPGGVIILAAECREGSGSAGFDTFMQDVTSIPQIFEKFSRLGFVVGPHKALQIARQLEKHTIILVSDVAPKEVDQWLIKPARSLDHAIQMASTGPISDQRWAILPYATGVFPEVRNLSSIDSQ